SDWSSDVCASGRGDSDNSGVGGRKGRSRHWRIPCRGEEQDALFCPLLNQATDQFAVTFAAEAEVDDIGMAIERLENSARDIEGARAFVAAVDVDGQNGQGHFGAAVAVFPQGPRHAIQNGFRHRRGVSDLIGWWLVIA